MKIVYCVASLHLPGGTERVLTTKVNALVESIDEVYILMHGEVSQPYFPISEKVKCITLNAFSKKKYRKELERFLYDLRPDITISVGGWELPYLNDIKDGSKKILEFHYTKNFLINFVKGIHNLPFKRLHLLKVWLLQKKLRIYARRFDKVVGLTERDVHLWGNPKNMTYIYNPLSFRTDRKSTLENKVIIAVGSFTPAKGMDLLIEAFGRVAHQFPDWRLELYGSGQEYGLLQELIAEYQIEKQVSVNHPYPYIAEKLLESSIYAFPSRSDGFGLVITEAMECGLPCVAFDCECGPREIVTVQTGLLVPPQNVEAFAEALKTMMLDGQLRKRMGKEASIEVSRFYVENIMPKWVELFNELKK